MLAWLLRWAAARRLRTLHALGGALGWLAWLASPRWRRNFAEQARLAGVARRDARAAVAAAGRMVAELPWLWLSSGAAPRRALGGAVTWVGEDVADAAIAAGRGVVALTPHLGSFEVCAQAWAERFGDRAPMTVLYRPARRAWLAEAQRGARDRPGLRAVPATLAGVRALRRALRAGGVVGLLPDQVPPDGQGVWAPWHGRPAYTMTLAARLVRGRAGATQLSMWAERLPRGRGWRVHVSRPAHPLPPAASPADVDDVADATAVNAEMQRLVAQCPSQYLWGYPRHKPPRRVPAA